MATLNYLEEGCNNPVNKNLLFSVQWSVLVSRNLNATFCCPIQDTVCGACWENTPRPLHNSSARDNRWGFFIIGEKKIHVVIKISLLHAPFLNKQAMNYLWVLHSDVTTGCILSIMVGLNISLSWHLKMDAWLTATPVWTSQDFKSRVNVCFEIQNCT